MKLPPLAITGLGIVSPLGHAVEPFYDALLRGESGIRSISSFDTRGTPCSIGGTVEGFDVSDFFTDRDSLRNLRVMDPVHQWAMAAASSALKDAGLEDELLAKRDDGAIDHNRLGICIGTGLSGRTDNLNVGAQMLGWLREDRSRLDLPPDELVHQVGIAMMQRTNPLVFLRQCPSVCAAYIAMRYKARGPNSTLVSLCAASAQAIGEAAWMIARGDADVMIVGGSDSMLNPTDLTAFCKLDAVSARSDEGSKACKPFDLRRDGCVVGEGAAFLVLERPEHAERRGARVHAYLAGYGTTADAYKISAPPENGDGAVQSMQRALASAGLAPEAVDHINAHGTSTPLNDRIETHAIQRVFGAHAARIPVVSTKSMTGHLIAAAGAIEAVASIMALKRKQVPPTINLEKPDPACSLDYVSEGARAMPDLQVVLSNSFAVGGVNATLIFRSAA